MPEIIISEEFIQQVKDWWIKLFTHIKETQDQGKKPILIALSRKMPRFIEWFKSAKEFEDGPDRNILNDLEITTELALPFILCGEDKNSDLLEFIIVDDIIIHGSTLRNISNCLYYVTKRIPYVSCIALHKKASIPKSVNVQNLVGMKQLSQQEVDEFVKTVAKIVETNQLPIDLEFPIFRTESDITSDEVEKKWDELSKIEDTDSCTSYQVGDLGNRICIIPKTGNFNIYVPDFTKFRFYKKEADAGNPSHIQLEVFAPTILNEYMLTSTTQELFTADMYKKLWEDTTSDIRKKIADLRKESSPECFDVTVNYTRSLCVWANFILSFCYYKFYKSKLESEQGLKDILKGYEISQENLRLILG
ncbi:MAG: hypothetical protein K2O05_00345, partial [Anaeroplasmataceae bacterium]|nr:hypothetical protein [Anaeroplasmataceae bacterium]